MTSNSRPNVPAADSQADLMDRLCEVLSPVSIREVLIDLEEVGELPECLEALREKLSLALDCIEGE